MREGADLEGKEMCMMKVVYRVVLDRQESKYGNIMTGHWFLDLIQSGEIIKF